MMIFKTIGGILLIVLALFLFVVITPLALLWKIGVSITNPNRKAVDVFAGMATYFVEIAASFDQLGNAAFSGFLNWLCIAQEKESYKFGDKDETISEVLGWNYRLNSLSKFGKTLVKFLDFLDRQHCRKAMYSGIEKAQRKIQFLEKISL
ncbi:hypothetical protein GGR32_000125 [Mesonia hippocampi]|uniref:Uncharacterized protein n=1 Tax=Mesonia hippocampi TaxID=1628250 RepID=A0A840EMJ2_9FLAO|nr:hypothetical protein [Mesonia hippocampi]MBB4117853.1 hypothetical protein [Mesonia hippocampi]